jgi:hypothetical protein
MLSTDGYAYKNANFQGFMHLVRLGYRCIDAQALRSSLQPITHRPQEMNAFRTNLSAKVASIAKL